MPLFRRKSSNEIPAEDVWFSDWTKIRCQPIDLERWKDEVDNRARPGFPGDSSSGQYLVALFVDRENRPCLAMERVATRVEAQDLLEKFARRSPTAPERLDAVHLDDIDGSWVVDEPRFAAGVLTIVHPGYCDAVSIQRMRSTYSLKRDESQEHIAMASGLHGTAQALRDPMAFFTHKPFPHSPPQRERVNPNRYGVVLNAALGRGFPSESVDMKGVIDLEAKIQEVFRVEPDDNLLSLIDVSALEYLFARCRQILAEGKYMAAVFYSDDKIFTQYLAADKEELDRTTGASLAKLQGLFREIYTVNPVVFESLGLGDHTLIGMRLDDIVENRAELHRSGEFTQLTNQSEQRSDQSGQGTERGNICHLCGTANPSHARFCAECGNRLVAPSA
jgi:hypothetical protein